MIPKSEPSPGCQETPVLVETLWNYQVKTLQVSMTVDCSELSPMLRHQLRFLAETGRLDGTSWENFDTMLALLMVLSQSQSGIPGYASSKPKSIKEVLEYGEMLMRRFGDKVGSLQKPGTESNSRKENSNEKV